MAWTGTLATWAQGFYAAVAGSKLAVAPDPGAASLPPLTLANASGALATLATFLQAHAAEIDAAAVDADAIARALAMAGLPGAALADEALRLEPAALAEACALLPILGKALPILAALQPAPTYQAGPDRTGR